MLLKMLYQRALRLLFSLYTKPPSWPQPVSEADVPSTIRLEQAEAEVPDTIRVDGWRALADRQSYRAAWIRRKAMRFGAPTRAELRDDVRSGLGGPPGRRPSA